MPIEQYQGLKVFVFAETSQLSNLDGLAVVLPKLKVHLSERGMIIADAAFTADLLARVSYSVSDPYDREEVDRTPYHVLRDGKWTVGGVTRKKVTRSFRAKLLILTLTPPFISESSPPSSLSWVLGIDTCERLEDVADEMLGNLFQAFPVEGHHSERVLTKSG